MVDTELLDIDTHAIYVYMCTACPVWVMPLPPLFDISVITRERICIYIYI